MSFYSNVTEQLLNNLRKLAEQQKNQRALKTKNKIFKQTHVIKLAESLSPITRKLDTMNESTKKYVKLLRNHFMKMKKFKIVKEPFQTTVNSLLICWKYGCFNE